jgi:GTP-binding protein EngB required for normal cell division
MFSKWTKKPEPKKVSPHLKGINLFNKMQTSLFGKVKQTFTEIFSQEDIKNYILPKVVVIGNESTGKSSLLENITKCQIFPRDNKLCTKCPVHVKMFNGSSNYIIYYDNSITKEKIVKKLQNKNEIYDVITEYMNSLPVDHISDKEITIEITDLDTPVFEFYDLPGIRTYPPEAAKTTLDLCKKYLSDKNSIVLCVVPASTTRLTSCQSIALITKMKMEQNCILALTMADRLQTVNIEELLVKRIVGTSDELAGFKFAGCVAIMNRTHTDTYSLEEHDVCEQEWFENNLLSNIPDEYITFEKQIRENITIVNLVSKMDGLYNKFIQSEWKPKILENITEKIELLQVEYDNLGTSEFIVAEINDCLTTFVNNLFNKFHDGKYNNTESFSELFKSYRHSNNRPVRDNEIEPECTPEIYYNLESNIKDTIDQYRAFKSTDILNEIDDYFKTEYIFKLERFEYVKKALQHDISIHYDKLVNEKMSFIHDSVHNKLVIDYGNTVCSHIRYYRNLVFRFYKLYVLHPLLMRTVKYEAVEFAESNEYIEKRQSVFKLIETMKNNYEKINKLN